VAAISRPKQKFIRRIRSKRNRAGNATPGLAAPGAQIKQNRRRKKAQKAQKD